MADRGYSGLLAGVSGLLKQARKMAARSLNTIIAATYWQIGRRIIEFEQAGKLQADYGTELLKRLGADLTQ